ncbi:MAG: hypothetical protein B0A82_00020 [Alkalinema sp. CACIAM 70d]|uniref:hypothetical protein n=1 Tax=Alkalinema sp. FACHB-956 TaxID=2692768 RepID=UPI000B688E90|nr:hypothetical protein [Alkalinema sp. FACHB-956]MBD2329805.1 hypothetical protein [Alkalinema sp. FACHB-956]OUC16740.1 MAG: hypothetical protein B0A82_00020 [Alkalinema sp. CACIAM 70d]
MSDSLRYITDNTGKQIGVLLDLDAYHQLTHPLLNDRQCLIGLSREELLVLANCKISPAEQSRLDELLAKNTEAQLSSTETSELDRILAEADHLMVLKARALYTLKRLDEHTIAS